LNSENGNTTVDLAFLQLLKSHASIQSLAIRFEQDRDLLQVVIDRIAFHALNIEPLNLVSIFGDLACSGYRHDFESAIAGSVDIAVDHVLALKGYIEGGAACEKCPVCNRTGWIGSPKHHSCFVRILTDNKGVCSHCQQRRTETIYKWKPVCTNCQDIAEHLETLYD
jgi:hypothetical protein